MKILITGTDGFMGGMLKSALSAEGHDVFGTVFIRPPDADEVHFDIRRADAFDALPDTPFDALIHTVGIVDQKAPAALMEQVNARGAARMARWAHENHCGHFIQLSSICVYGPLHTNGQQRREDNTPRYDGPFAIPYMRTKASAEREIIASGVPYTILRLPGVLGAHDTYLSPAIIDRLLDGTFAFCGSGDRRFSTLFVKNLPAIISRVLDAGPLHDCFNCTDGETSWREFVAEYARALEVPMPRRRRPLLSIIPRLNDKHWALIITFSRFGGQYPNDRLVARIDGLPPVRPWTEGVQEAVQASRASREVALLHAS